MVHLGVVEEGDEATVDGHKLKRVVVRSNVGYDTCWRFSSCDVNDWGVEYQTWCDPQRPVDGEGFLHGDFNAPWRGPDRATLILLAKASGRFVEAFLTRAERDNAALDAATATVEGAASALSEA